MRLRFSLDKLISIPLDTLYALFAKIFAQIFDIGAQCHVAGGLVIVPQGVVDLLVTELLVGVLEKELEQLQEETSQVVTRLQEGLNNQRHTLSRLRYVTSFLQGIASELHQRRAS